MVTERDVVVEVLRSRGEHDMACQAVCALPAYVDTDQDAAVLARLGGQPGDAAGLKGPVWTRRVAAVPSCAAKRSAVSARLI